MQKILGRAATFLISSDLGHESLHRAVPLPQAQSLLNLVHIWTGSLLILVRLFSKSVFPGFCESICRWLRMTHQHLFQGSFFAENVAEEGYMTFLKSLGENLYQFLSNSILDASLLSMSKHILGAKRGQVVLQACIARARPNLTALVDGRLIDLSCLQLCKTLPHHAGEKHGLCQTSQDENRNTMALTRQLQNWTRCKL